MQSLWLRVSNRGEKHPVGTRFCSAKSSVLYLLRPLTRERGCHRTGQTVSCGCRRTNICRHGRLALGFLRSAFGQMKTLRRLRQRMFCKSCMRSRIFPGRYMFSLLMHHTSLLYLRYHSAIVTFGTVRPEFSRLCFSIQSIRWCFLQART